MEFAGSGKTTLPKESAKHILLLYIHLTYKFFDDEAIVVSQNRNCHYCDYDQNTKMPINKN